MKRKKHQESRRDFIKTSGWITATALAAPLSSFAQPGRSLLEREEKESAGHSLQTPEWITRYTELKVQVTEKRARAVGIPVQPIRKKFGKEASSFSIDLRGVETLFLSAARGN
ncbi:MAG: twin-arginine translocation signal domain-containing protein [Fermentimonas sp.]|jgi:secreted protein with Ig-like and vWFA domain